MLSITGSLCFLLLALLPPSLIYRVDSHVLQSSSSLLLLSFPFPEHHASYSKPCQDSLHASEVYLDLCTIWFLLSAVISPEWVALYLFYDILWPLLISFCLLPSTFYPAFLLFSSTGQQEFSEGFQTRKVLYRSSNPTAWLYRWEKWCSTGSSDLSPATCWGVREMETDNSTSGSWFSRLLLLYLITAIGGIMSFSLNT